MAVVCGAFRVGGTIREGRLANNNSSIRASSGEGRGTGEVVLGNHVHIRSLAEFRTVSW